MSLSSEAISALLALPALAPPEGVTPEFDNPPNQNGLAWGVTTFCMVVATICLFLRAYTKFWIERRPKIEEVMMLCAYGAYWGTAYAGYGMIWSPGYYVHTWNLHNGDLIKPLYLILVYGCCYSAVLPFIKIAILIDWARIFVPGNSYRSPFWWGCMFIIFIQATWGVACITLLNMQCVPHNAIWEFYVPSKCYSLPKVMLTSASVQVATDFMMVLLPQRVIWTLHMNLQKKMGIALLFGVGIVACIAACFRLSHTITFATETDTMYFIGPLLFWACAEMTCGFFIFSVPCIPKILNQLRLSPKIRKVLGLSSDDSSNANAKYNPPSGPNLNKLAVPGKSNDNYYKIDKYGVPMTNICQTESQERLREEDKEEKNIKVTRTTHIAVEACSESCSEDKHQVPSFLR